MLVFCCIFGRVLGRVFRRVLGRILGGVFGSLLNRHPETLKFCLICGGYLSRLWPDLADILGCDDRSEGALVNHRCVTKYMRVGAENWCSLLNCYEMVIVLTPIGPTCVCLFSYLGRDQLQCF